MSFHPEDQSNYKDFVCGGTAALLNVCIMFPFYKTVFFQQLDNLTWSQACIRLYKEGPKHIYRGVGPPLIQNTVNRSIMFGIYGKCFTYFKQDDIVKSHQLKIGIASSMAGITEACVVPFERVQTILQNKTYHHRYMNTFHAFRKLIKENGVKELYRGFWTVCMRNICGNTIYFSICDRNVFHADVDLLSNSSINTLIHNFFIGGMLGAVIGMVIYPLNVVKTRQQTYVGGSFFSAFSQIKLIYKERGNSFVQIYKGLPANSIRSVVSWGLITMFNEWLRGTKFIQYYFD